MNDLIKATVRTIQLELGKEPASWYALADMLRDEGRPEEEAQTIEIGATLAYAGGDSRYEGRFLCRTVSVWLSGDPVARCCMVAAATQIVIEQKPWTWQPVHRNFVLRTPAGIAQKLLRERWSEMRAATGYDTWYGTNYVEMLYSAVEQLARYHSRLFRQK